VRFVVDSSAVLAVRQAEPEREAFHDLLLRGRPCMSVATQAELVLVWQARFGAASLPDLDLMLADYGVVLEPVEASDIVHLRHAVERYAKGRRAEPACLNFGDLFAYTLARRLDLPLLFKGEDFAQTDIRVVPWRSG
jgi:ribonuclease VapC